MLIQINSLEELKMGEEVLVINTGEMITTEEGTEEPSLKVVKKNHSKDEADQFVAVVPAKKMSRHGGANGVDLVQAMPELQKTDGEVMGVVVDSVETEFFYNGYVIEIKNVLNKEEEMRTAAGMELIDLKISGSIMEHDAKMDVISDFLDGEDVIVEIITGNSGEPAIVYPKIKEGHGGRLATAGDIEFEDDSRDTLMKILKQKDKIEGRVFEAEDSTYRVRLGMDAEELEAIVEGKEYETVETIKEEIHKTVGTPLQTLDNIHAYLHSQGIIDRNIKSLLKMIRNYDDSVVDFIPQEPKTPYQDNKGLLSRAINYLLGRDSILMAGDAATGKNLMAETLCWIIQKPYRFYSINIQTDKYDLAGRTVLQSQSEGGGTKVQDSFLVSMMKHGGAILLDEINASNPAVMTLLHSIVEKGHKMIDIEASDERVVAQEDFVLFGAMNPGYMGTSDLNEALHSRFVTLNFGKNDDILDLLKVHHESKDAPIEMLERVNQLYGTLFEEVQNGILNAKVLSFRRYASAVNYANGGLVTLKDSLIDNVANLVFDADENVIVLDAIDTHIG